MKKFDKTVKDLLNETSDNVKSKNKIEPLSVKGTILSYKNGDIDLELATRRLESLIESERDTIINDIPVNFRQMCGFQTSRRIKPENAYSCLKEVLYYDGNMYQGWQLKENEPVLALKHKTINKKLLKKIDNLVKVGIISEDDKMDILN